MRFKLKTTALFMTIVTSGLIAVACTSDALPTATPTTAPAATAVPTAAPTATAIPPTPTLPPPSTKDLDRAAIEDVVELMAKAFRGESDISAWYEICSPVIREAARDQRVFETYLDDEHAQAITTLAVVDVFYAGPSSATVTMTVNANILASDFQPTLGVQFAKVDDAWYNNGFACELG